MPRPAALSMTIVAFAATIGLAWAQASASAPLPDPKPQLGSDRAYLLDALMERVRQDYAIPGLAIGVVEDGAPAYMRAFGVRDMQKLNEPLTTHSLFYVGRLIAPHGKSQVTEPDGMIEQSGATAANLAWPHTGDVIVRRVNQFPAGLVASVSDVTEWAAANLNHPAPDRPDELRDVGSGFASMVTFYPQEQRAIVILSNGENTPRREIRTLIESVLAGEGYSLPRQPLLMRADFQWSMGGLLFLTLVLVAMTVRNRRRRTVD